MSFVADAENVARCAMRAINPALVDKYALLIRFLASQPNVACPLRGLTAPPTGSQEYIRRKAVAFSQARENRAPREPVTIPDEVVSIILTEHFHVPERDIERIKREHSLSMAAESVVGSLLEHYLATVLEPNGWIWCGDAIVKAADFLKPPARGEPWRLLQVKNRDNSENSSSSAIRIGTKIEKWHRTFSRRPGSNWAAFPDDALRQQLSEENFRDFVRASLRAHGR
jgi:hypothetical protein